MKVSRSILLVHPSGHARSTLQEERFVRFQPLGLAYIAAATPDDWKVSLIDESIRDIDDFSGYAIVGVSTNTRTALRAYQLAEKARKAGCYTVAGGIHVSMCREEALRYFDTVICGEGERLWREFLADFAAGDPKREYTSTGFEDMDAIPFPDRRIMGQSYTVASIQTSRGCPFNCSFCSVSAFNGKKYRCRRPEAVIEELGQIPQRFLFFVDDNLIGCSRNSIDRAKRIFQGMIDRRMNKKFLAQVTINFGLDDELVTLAYKGGCRGVFIGIESVDAKVLKSMNKAINLKAGVDNYRDIFRAIQRRGIAVIATMTIANDDEPDDIFEKTAEFVETSGVDAIQLTISTPLPGTNLFEQLSNERRIVFNDFPADWVHYSLGSLVFIPKHKSALQVIDQWRKLIDTVYSTRRTMLRSCRTLVHTRNLVSTYLSYKLNKAYRKSYLSSLFYNSPPIEKFKADRVA
jgi:radical SAM superfamily enzyme YgiQ (UPF0313 family)